MIPIQPVGWWHYLSIKPNNQALTNSNHFFYLSWEDALWDLIKHFNYSPGSLVLLPDFYCADVVQNMKGHGLNVVTYPVDLNFQTQPEVFAQYLQRYQPQITIIFHAVGITNQLFEQTKLWQKSLPKETLLIEDSVHQLVDSRNLKFITDRHIVLDSLRKVVPLQGSNLYGGEAISNLKQTKGFLTFFYQFKVIFWWLLFQLCLIFTFLLPFNFWKNWWNRLAEKMMLIGYDVIGDSQLAGSGLKFFAKLNRYIDRQKIAQIKAEQVKFYQEQLASVWQSKAVFKIKINESNYGQLRALPVGLKLVTAKKVLTLLRQAGLIIRFELDNFGWSKKQKVIYLPLGPHLSNKDLIFVTQTLKKTLSNFT